MKKALWYIVGIGIFLVSLMSLSWLLSIHEMLIYQDHVHTITVQNIPYLPLIRAVFMKHYPDKAVLTISSSTFTYRAKLSFDFVQPGIVTYSAEAKRLYIIYFADLSYEFLVIEPSKNMTEGPAQDALLSALIEPLHGKLLIRYMTTQELGYMFSTLKQLSEKEYQKHSIPTLDVGFYKYYVPQEFLLEILTKEIERRTSQQHS